MAVFISHSFENKPEFDNIADQLNAAAVPYRDPNNVKPGSSLRQQLRDAVAQCSACIFVATHSSLDSSWCGAELGAFWGTGKTIIVYVADSSLKEDDLPPIVHGDVWERRISRVVSRAREITLEAEASVAKDEDVRSPSVGNMAVDELEQLIRGAVALATAEQKTGVQRAGPDEISQVAHGATSRFLEGIRSARRGGTSQGDEWQKRILWVDDRPDYNINERSAFEALGLTFVLAETTADALEILSTERFAAIISDMGRREGSREGYVLLDAVRSADKETPFFIYAGSAAPEHRREATLRGAQGTTNRPQELYRDGNPGIAG